MAFRWGIAPPTPELSQVFAELRAANTLARSQLSVAQSVAASAVLLASTFEQRHVVQPLFERMGRTERNILAKNLGFRMGRDASAPFLRCDGDGTGADVRCAWMAATVLPRWQGYSLRNEALIKADMEFFRREARLPLSALPATST